MTGHVRDGDTEVLVVGGGPGGYATAIRGAQCGLDVMLVDDAELGGTCLNHGCIPSRALLTATDVAHRTSAGESIGVYADATVDFPALMGWKDNIVGRLTEGVRAICELNGVLLRSVRATFESDRTATVVTPGGTESIVGLDSAVIAAGSRPVELPKFDFDADPILDAA